MAAAPRLELSLTGHDAIVKAFNELPAKLQRSILRPALRAGAKVLRASVQASAPRSDEAPHMADSLKIKALKRKRGRVGYVVITAKRPILGIKAADTYYPAHIEYGYRHNGKHVPANPWMKRGLEAGRAAAMNTVAREIGQRMKSKAGLADVSDKEFFADLGGDGDSLDVS